MSDQPDFSSFLNEAGWGDAVITAMTADAGLRRYFKLERDGKQALLMDMSRSGYEASLDAFINIGRMLEEKQVCVPAIYHASLDQGLAVIEDFGQISFGDQLKQTDNPAELYEIATDVLIAMRERVTENELRLGTYDQSRIRERLSQFADYYVPAASNVQASDEIQKEFQSVMRDIESGLSDCALGFCHADYHLENLMWRSDAAEKYGLIDFQDAFWGPLAYDLLNLLEDARQTVPEEIKAAMKDRYCQGMNADERQAFDDWYVLLSAHFHCRVIGLFVKLYQDRGMDDYLKHIPRLQHYIKGHLQNPVMAPLKDFIARYDVSLDVDLSALLKAG